MTQRGLSLYNLALFYWDFRLVLNVHWGFGFELKIGWWNSWKKWIEQGL